MILAGFFSGSGMVTLYIQADVPFQVHCAGVFGAVSRTDWVCVVLIVLGVVLFLIGANYYNSLVGWLGVFLLVGGTVAMIVMYVYGILSKHANPVDKPQNV
jgi:hypothetical protein